MLTTIVCFINCVVTMFGDEGFIKDFDMAYCCALLEFILTIGILGIVYAFKGDK